MRHLTLLLAAGAVAACTVTAPLVHEVCNGADDDADGAVDEGYDGDGDGFYPCGTTADCDDADPAVHPGALERCDGRDDDCDGSIPPVEADADNDGARTCAGDCDDEDASQNLQDADADGWSSCGGDCADLDPTRYPGGPEVCDGVDGNCDGWLGDELDADGDGQRSCAGDCDDADPARDTADRDGDGIDTCGAFPDCDDGDPDVYPWAWEACDDVDADCDGDTADGC